MKKLLLTCSILILAMFLPAAVHGQTSGTQDSQTPANRFDAGRAQMATADGAASGAQRNAQIKKTVERALSILIPGGIVEGTPRKEKFAAVIDSFSTGQARDALEALQKMSAEDANLPPAEVMLAGLTFAVGDQKSGLALLESSAIKYPQYPGIFLSFAQIALNTNRVTDASLHAAEAARLIDTANLTQEQKTHFFKQYYQVATGVFLRRKQYPEAGKMLEQLQKVAPNRPFYFLTKAEMVFREGNNDAALQLLKQHANSIESKRLPELTLVDWLKNSGKDESAEQLLARTVDQYPGDAQARLMTAQMYMAKENFRGALDALKKFEELNDGETNQSLDIKGRIAFAGLNYDIAAGHFRKLVQRAPNDPSSANILALCLIESKDPEARKQAQQISQRVAGRMSGNPLAIASLGYIYLKNGEKEKSAQLMQRVVMTRQGTPEISWFLANWLAENGQKDQAVRLIQQAVDTKGLFLYRTAGRQFLTSLKEQ